jgi:DNA-binding response OmpR family regulator
MTAPAPRRILLVEDEPRNAALIQAVLGPAGFDVEWVTGVAAARAALAESDPALILLDLRLPDEPGHVLARELRARGERRPIFAVSASVLEATRREALESGCDDFIEKPISPRDLLARVQARLAQGEDVGV